MSIMSIIRIISIRRTGRVSRGRIDQGMMDIGIKKKPDGSAAIRFFTYQSSYSISVLSLYPSCYSTVTLLARFLGLSTSLPLATEV